MRKAVVCVLSYVACVAGCTMPGEKVGWGYEYRMYKPAVIKTDGQVLINQGSGEVGAQPVGTVAGPVNFGQWQQQGRQQGPMPPIVPFQMNRIISDPCPPNIAGQQVADPCANNPPNAALHKRMPNAQ